MLHISLRDIVLLFPLPGIAGPGISMWKWKKPTYDPLAKYLLVIPPLGSVGLEVSEGEMLLT